MLEVGGAVMSQITTTLNEIRKHKPCEDGWEKLLKHLGKTKADDEPFPMSVILDSNDLDDCLWAMRCRPDLDSLWRLYAVDCARQVQHLMTDQRSIDVLDVAERYALGEASDKELEAAWEAARVAAWTAAQAVASALASALACRKQTAALREMLDTGERPDWSKLEEQS
jgi:hypothetical protein